MFRLLVADRQRGKSTQAFNWVSHGVRIPHYPGWSRVLVLPTMQRMEAHRVEWWEKLEDFDHRVYAAGDWMTAHQVHRDVEVCIDDLDAFLGLGFRLATFSGNIVCATITAKPWEPVEYNEEAARAETP